MSDMVNPEGESIAITDFKPRHTRKLKMSLQKVWRHILQHSSSYIQAKLITRTHLRAFNDSPIAISTRSIANAPRLRVHTIHRCSNQAKG